MERKLEEEKIKALFCLCQKTMSPTEVPPECYTIASKS